MYLVYLVYLPPFFNPVFSTPHFPATYKHIHTHNPGTCRNIHPSGTVTAWELVGESYFNCAPMVFITHTPFPNSTNKHQEIWFRRICLLWTLLPPLPLPPSYLLNFGSSSLLYCHGHHSFVLVSLEKWTSWCLILCVTLTGAQGSMKVFLGEINI